MVHYSDSLSLNVSKTDTILFSKIPSIVKITDSFLATLPLSNKITTLGITIDSIMKYDSHILNVIRTANFYLYNIHKARAKLSFDITKSLIYSLVFSRFDYCNSLFVFVPDNIMIKFEKIQRRAVRVLYKIKNNINTNTGSNYISISHIMLTLGWLRYRDLCWYNSYFHMLYHIIHNVIPLFVTVYRVSTIVETYNHHPARLLY